MFPPFYSLILKNPRFSRLANFRSQSIGHSKSFGLLQMAQRRSFLPLMIRIESWAKQLGQVTLSPSLIPNKTSISVSQTVHLNFVWLLL